MNECNILRAVAAAGLSVVLLGACGDKSEAQAKASDQAAAPAQASADGAPAATQTVTPADKPVATLGDVSISRADIEDVLRGLTIEQRMQLQADRASLDQWLRARLAEKALIAQAGNQGWASRPEIRRALELTRDQVVLRTYLESVSEPPADYPSRQELQAAYDQNKARLTVPARYRISQIYLAAPYTDGQAVARASKQAVDLVKRVRAEKADFAALAREYSQDKTSAEKGGDSGEMALQQLIPGLREVVQKMAKGEVSDPIQLPGGVHIVKVVDVHEAQAQPLAQVEDQLRAALRTQRQQQAARAYLEGLINGGTVSIDGGEVSAAFEAASHPAVGATSPPPSPVAVQ